MVMKINQWHYLPPILTTILMLQMPICEAQTASPRLAPVMQQKLAHSEKLRQILSQQAHAWDQAIVSKNRPAIAANMSEDFRQIGPNGELEDKASFIAGLMAPELKINPYTVDEFEIRLYGKTALLSGLIRMSGEYQGQPFTSNYRYLDVYVQRGKQWQVVSVQLTKLAP